MMSDVKVNSELGGGMLEHLELNVAMSVARINYVDCLVQLVLFVILDVCSL